MSDRSSSDFTRTCPWCAEATVVALSEEGMVRALARHLERCLGEVPPDGR